MCNAEYPLKIGEFLVYPLILKGKNHYAHHCRECGVPLPRWGGYGKKRSLCKSCNGKRTGKMGNE